MQLLLADCRELVVDQNRLPDVLCVFGPNAYYFLRHVPYKGIVAFWHITNKPLTIS